MDSEHEDRGISIESVAQQFHAWRTTAGLTIEDIARELSFSPVIVQAFEDGRYSAFPARVYAHGYLKRIVERFSISTGEDMLRQLRDEWIALHGEKELMHASVSQQKRKNFYITPRRLLGCVGGVALVFFFWFLMVQLTGFTGAPMLRIDTPAADMAMDTSWLEVRGKTDKESQLTVNGREITMDEFGNFNQQIELIPGLNTLHFLVKNRFGKISAMTRHIIVQ